jgi:pyruvate ferredoxin oxidoreductase beta subunit
MQNLLAPGHRACAGCSMPIVIRLVLDAAGPNTIVVSPTSCLEVTTTPFPESAWEVPWIHSLFENAAAVASGVEVVMKRQCKDTNVLVIGGDGSTFDIGMGSNSGMFECGHKITYICYDNEAYMNTGVQRSGSTPFCAITTTTPAGELSLGNPRPKKDMPAIALAHGVPYVATASIAYPVDLRKKVKRALQVKGPSYIQVNAPCITGWTYDTGNTIEIARLAVETGLLPLFEYLNGELGEVKKIRRPKAVDEYLKVQGRFRHLYKQPGGAEIIKSIQEIANRNIEKYKLVD